MAAKETGVHVYAADVSGLADGALYAATLAAVSDTRREKTERLCFAKDRYLSLGAELLLHRALRAAGADDGDPELVYGPEGKPYLKSGAAFFSISHSGTYAVCAAADCEVGCDAEKIRPVSLNVARRFAPEEYADILAQNTESARLELFYRYWTLKESFMKATGLGMRLPMRSFRIVRGEEISVVQSADARSYTFAEFTELPGYRCALCAAGDCRTAQLHILPLRELLPPDAAV